MEEIVQATLNQIPTVTTEVTLLEETLVNRDVSRVSFHVH